MKRIMQTRFQNKRRSIEKDIKYLKKMLIEEKYGVCEGTILRLQTELTLLYGLLVGVQDEKIKGESK